MFSLGETTSAHCADNAASNILWGNSVVSCRNVVYWQHWSPGGCVTVLPRDMLRWRAADSRPYELKNYEPSANYHHIHYL
nr:MAG TPA: hypothetical protein [Caudoviricetes sp.]